MRVGFRTLLAAALACLAGLASGGDPGVAQSIPSPIIQEVLIKGTLLTLNDAIVTDNFAVMHAKLCAPFRSQMTSAKLRDIFKSFIDGHAVFDIIAAKPPVQAIEAKIDDEGVLRLNGYFDTTPKRFNYQLGYIRSEGDWKLSAINIDIK